MCIKDELLSKSHLLLNAFTLPNLFTPLELRICHTDGNVALLWQLLKHT